MTPRAQQWIDELGLAPHPEGGFFRETFRSAQRIATPRGDRAASTAIYFLLPEASFSAFHRVSSDEVWHLYDGALQLHMIDDRGATLVNLTQQRPQAVVPAGVWQAARPLGSHALCGCTVAPGFEFADFELPTTQQLVDQFPQHAAVIRSLTR
ncbi:MAG: cupin domain-containing protein [Kofleriaceae bacterium]